MIYSTPIDWTRIDTGGGCNALQKIDGRHYWLITALGDPSVPDTDTEEVTLSLWCDATGEMIGSATCPNVSAAFVLSEKPVNEIEGFIYETK